MPPPTIQTNNAGGYADHLGVWLLALLALFVLMAALPYVIRFCSYIFWLFSPSGRALAARHEAGHALVAVLLDRDFTAARVSLSRKFGGAYVRFLPPTCGPQNDVGYVRRTFISIITTDLAGVIAERRWKDRASILARFRTQKDWFEAEHLAFVFQAIEHNPLILDEIISALQSDMANPSWEAAILEAANLLIRSPKKGVDPKLFCEIVKRNTLELPQISKHLANSGSIDKANNSALVKAS
ncbi:MULTISPECIES: hypothetical protein [Hyphomicrobiales]|uniref:hypothetical protein n=1 Tax=Hyphomicrobiales TaxID=356 RepID=UPI002119DA91|nr:MULTISPECIES: hypothetical protein [Hyphomicrobiales]MCQ9147351.1 hypothetical protein [Ochrobactrum sp. BTU2]MDH1270331.1 hypothetical protein [Agrobacterium pusense]MDX4076596.1 hypothetical protein [Brucella sp. NBRC 113783]